MKIKKSTYVLSLLALVISTSMMLSACSAKPAAASVAAETSSQIVQEVSTTAESTSAPAVTETTEKTFTLEELATYTGKDGTAAYVAVDGVVYDVSNVRKWRNGSHQDGIVAGVDLTNLMSQSPHGLKVLSEAVRVGVLAG